MTVISGQAKEQTIPGWHLRYITTTPTNHNLSYNHGEVQRRKGYRCCGHARFCANFLGAISKFSFIHSFKFRPGLSCHRQVFLRWANESPSILTDGLWGRPNLLARKTLQRLLRAVILTWKSPEKGRQAKAPPSPPAIELLSLFTLFRVGSS